MPMAVFDKHAEPLEMNREYTQQVAEVPKKSSLPQNPFGISIISESRKFNRTLRIPGSIKRSSSLEKTMSQTSFKTKTVIDSGVSSKGSRRVKEAVQEFISSGLEKSRIVLELKSNLDKDSQSLKSLKSKVVQQQIQMSLLGPSKLVLLEFLPDHRLSTLIESNKSIPLKSIYKTITSNLIINWFEKKNSRRTEFHFQFGVELPNPKFVGSMGYLSSNTAEYRTAA